MSPRPPSGYKPRPASDPHVGLRYRLSPSEKARLDALGVIDLLPNAPPNRFQYRAGSCTGQGLGHATYYVMRQAAKDGLLGFEPFSPSSLAIYAWERMAAGTFLNDDGSTIVNGVEVLSSRGVPREELTALHAQPFTIAGCGSIESLNLATTVNMCAYKLSR